MLEIFETAADHFDLDKVHEEILGKSLPPIKGVEYEKEDLFKIMSRLISKNVDSR